VPETAARIEDDRNLTDGARRCARKLAEYVYRKNREGREAEITVSYLAKALGRCRRTVQRYLRQLEREGYIDVSVVPSERTRMCFGLVVRLLNPLLPKHRRHKWPESRRNPAATTESQIYIQRFKRRPVKREIWAFLCCEGVWRGYMKTRPPLAPFPGTA
jgi:broad specificity phosphatase PhoE